MDDNRGISAADLRKISRDLRAFEPELQKELAKTWRETAKTASTTARNRIRAPYVYGTGGEPKTRAHKGHGKRASSGITAGADNLGPFVRMSRKSSPHLRWLEFGGDLKASGRRRNTQSRERKPWGRFTYPAVFATRPEMTRRALAELDAVIAKFYAKS